MRIVTSVFIFGALISMESSAQLSTDLSQQPTLLVVPKENVPVLQPIEEPKISTDSISVPTQNQPTVLPSITKPKVVKSQPVKKPANQTAKIPAVEIKPVSVKKIPAGSSLIKNSLLNPIGITKPIKPASLKSGGFKKAPESETDTTFNGGINTNGVGGLSTSGLGGMSVNNFKKKPTFGQIPDISNNNDKKRKNLGSGLPGAFDTGLTKSGINNNQPTTSGGFGSKVNKGSFSDIAKVSGNSLIKSGGGSKTDPDTGLPPMNWKKSKTDPKTGLPPMNWKKSKTDPKTGLPPLPKSVVEQREFDKLNKQLMDGKREYKNLTPREKTIVKKYFKPTKNPVTTKELEKADKEEEKKQAKEKKRKEEEKKQAEEKKRKEEEKVKKEKKKKKYDNPNDPNPDGVSGDINPLTGERVFGQLGGVKPDVDPNLEDSSTSSSDDTTRVPVNLVKDPAQSSTQSSGTVSIKQLPINSAGPDGTNPNESD